MATEEVDAAHDSQPGVLVPLLATLIFAPELLGLGALGKGAGAADVADFASALEGGTDAAASTADAGVAASGGALDPEGFDLE